MLHRLEAEKARAAAQAQSEAQSQVQDDVSRILSVERAVAQESLQQAIIRERIATEDERLRAQLFVSLSTNSVNVLYVSYCGLYHLISYTLTFSWINLHHSIKQTLNIFAVWPCKHRLTDESNFYMKTGPVLCSHIPVLSRRHTGVNLFAVIDRSRLVQWQMSGLWAVIHRIVLTAR